MIRARKPEQLCDVVRHDEPMHKHTSWRVGGPADIYIQPHDMPTLQAFLASLDDDTPLLMIGLGSNLLVRDRGIRGAVVNTRKVFADLEKVGTAGVRAGAGVACTQLARKAALWDRGPAEFFAGIPGTVGGALTMNAGAFGGETWDHVVAVDVINRAGETFERSPEDYDIGYRHVGVPNDEWFCAAHFEFDPDYDHEQTELQDMMAARKNSQPLGLPSCGSVFRNPPNDHAARLIETAGLKGYRLGGAQVSPKHANFIINTDKASAADIEALITYVQSTVQDVHGIELQHEVRIVGEAA